MGASYAYVFFSQADSGDNGPMPEGYVNIHQAAERLGIKEQQVRDMIRGNLIKPEDREQVGRTWLIKESALQGLKPGKKGRPKKIKKE